MGKNSKDKRDVFYRLAKEDDFRARSIYKLLQIDAKFNLLKFAKNIVDLCAAPGSWSQGVSQILNAKESNVNIIAVDLQKMENIPGVKSFVGDITMERTAKEIFNMLEKKQADLVMCDGASDTTGMHYIDERMNYLLLQASFGITTHVLKKEGNFICKIFYEKNTYLWATKLLSLFLKVSIAKPQTSRLSSNEAFLVCQNYQPPLNFKLNLKKPGQFNLLYKNDFFKLDINDNRKVEFVVCRSNYDFDGDTSYSNDIEHITGKKYISRDPIQNPTNPPYKKAICLKKQIN